MKKMWRGVLAVVALAACHAPSAKPKTTPVSWVVRQIAAGYFPAPGICGAEAPHRHGVQREALLRCAMGDFDGAVYYAQLALEDGDQWRPKPLA